jgi:hypothetical protein
VPITYGDARTTLARYAGRGGKCTNDKETDLFVKKVLQHMLFKGSYGNLRKFCFCSYKGCITIPYELETPLKVKIGNRVGTVWDKWFEYYNIGEMESCVPCSEAMYEEPNRFPTVYDAPSGSRIGVLATACESVDAHVIVQGKDPTGREVITNHEGTQITGEYLRVTKGQLRYTQVAFGVVTGIQKTKTNGYVQLFWVNPSLNTKGFLADYAPGEELPSYRRYKLTNQFCNSTVQVSVLGRIRLKDNYADNDIIPFENLYALELAGQSINANFNNDPEMAKAKDGFLQDSIISEGEYKRVQNGQPVDIMYMTSAGAVKNIV